MEAHIVKWFEPFSEQDMLEKFDVDTSIRETDKLKHNSWPTSMRRADWEVSQIMNYQTTILLKRRYPELYDTIIDVMQERLATLPPIFEKKHYENVSWVLWQVLLTDAHIDQLDTKGTTFLSRKKRILTATQELLKKIDLFEPEQLVFANLGDYFNTALRNKTANGTEQQNIMKENDALRFGIDLEAEILLQMSEYAPTWAIHVDGNHDEGRLETLRQVMKYYFISNPNVNISDDDAAFQFYEWGNSMFGYDHGHQAKPKQLPEIMSDKKGKKHTNLEWYRWHLHHEKVESISWLLIHNLSNSWLQSEREKNKWYSHAPNITWLVHDKKGKIAQLQQRM